jgi:2-polyprenyl-3-methyl-5-hydroxy-6-metoxy-1,4-benzoquinol methylase
MITDNLDFWNKKAMEDNWQDYILPGRNDNEFEYEGKTQVEKFNKFIKNDFVIIDYGCGVGRMARYLKSRCKNVIGIDICSAFIEKAKIRNADIDGIDFFTVNQSSEIKEIADLIICIMVMQHNNNENREIIISNIYRLLKPGKTCLISFPKNESKIYRETDFVHKFSYKEVENYGRYFSEFSIIEDNLVNYQKRNIIGTNEYFLKGIK